MWEGALCSATLNCICKRAISASKLARSLRNSSSLEVVSVLWTSTLLWLEVADLREKGSWYMPWLLCSLEDGFGALSNWEIVDLEVSFSDWDWSPGKELHMQLESLAAWCVFNWLGKVRSWSEHSLAPCAWGVGDLSKDSRGLSLTLTGVEVLFT